MAGSLMTTVVSMERLLVQEKDRQKFVLEQGRTAYMTDVLYIPAINRKMISVLAFATKRA